MSRFVLTKPVIIPAVSYNQPARVLPAGATVELSAGEVTTVGAGNLRATAPRDQLGEGVGVSN